MSTIRGFSGVAHGLLRLAHSVCAVVIRPGVVALGLFTLVSCSSSNATEANQPAARGSPLNFAYRGAGNTVFESEETRGRATIVALVTTYDMASQLLLRRIDDAIRVHRPRANAGAVVMEPRKYLVLLEPYKDTLGLSFPVVLADHATQQGRGPFGDVDFLPVMVVLDPQGRVVRRYVGQVEPHTIREALEEASPSRRGTR